MHRTTIYLDDDIYQTIRRLARERATTQAEIIRGALRRALDTDRPRLTCIGVGQGDGTDVGRKAEALLDEAGRKAEWRSS